MYIAFPDTEVSLMCFTRKRKQQKGMRSHHQRWTSRQVQPPHAQLTIKKHGDWSIKHCFHTKRMPGTYEHELINQLSLFTITKDRPYQLPHLSI